MHTQQRFWLTFIVIGVLAATSFYFINHTDEQTVQSPQATNTSPPTNSVTPVSTQTIHAETQSNTVKKPTDDSAHQLTPELQERLTAMQTRRPEQHFNAADVAAAVARTTTWSTTDTIHRELPLAEEEFTDGRQFIELDSLKIETLMPGDQVNVRIDEKSNDYEVTIDRIEKHDYNSISWYGHIEGNDGQRYQVSFTRGENLTVGGMDTPDGHFVIQAHGNKGWVASSQLLFKQDTSVTDAIHPADVDPHYQHDNHPH